MYYYKILINLFSNETPSLLTIYSNGSNAIIYSTSTGIGIVAINENGITVMILSITISSFSGPIDNFVYATTPLGSITFSDNPFYMINITSIISNSSDPSYSYFVFGSTNLGGSSISSQFFGPLPEYVAVAAYVQTSSYYFLCLRNYPSSSYMNELPIVGSSYQTNITGTTASITLSVPYLSCPVAKYAIFAQSNLIVNTAIVIGSALSASNTLNVSFVSGPILLSCSYFIGVAGYSNFSNSVGLVYCDIIPNLAFTISNTLSFTANVPNTINQTNYVWFAQVNSITNTNLYISSVNASGIGNSINISYNNSSGSTITANMSIFAFVSQPTNSFTLSISP
jgi:hypothetical protein